MKLIEVEILQWDKHQPRKDIKHPTWFALSNRILEDAKLFDLDPIEWKALLYVFCQASQQNKAKVVLSVAHARRICDIQEKSLITVLSKLAYAGVTSAYAVRTDTLRDTTLQDTTEQNTTKHDKTVPARTKPVAPVDLDLNRRIWESYSNAYFTRYGTEPVRNASVNSKIKQVGQRLGEEGPDVAAYYLTLQKQYYVSAVHPIGAFLNDCEAIRTQWATGKAITNKQAQQADNSSALREQLKKYGGVK